MEMKFHQLRPGQRFQWQGETYEKINPLLARNLDGGGQRLIPRSTSVNVSEGDLPTPPATAARTMDLREIRRAFEDYHHSSLHWLERLDGAEETTAQARDALERARERFLSLLGEEGKTASAFPDGNAD